jgi:hypothetical protein
MVVRRFDGPRRAQLGGCSYWHLGARRTDCRTGHISPRDAGRPAEPRRTARTECRRGRNRTRRYASRRTPTCGNGRTGAGAQVNGASSEASHGAAEEVSSTFRLVSPSTMSQASGSDTDTTASPARPLPNVRWWVGYRNAFASLAVRVPPASSAASEVTWRSGSARCRAARTVGPPENIAADIRLVGPWRSLSGPCSGPLRSSTCIVTRQPSVQITWRPTSAALADIRSQRTMPSACGGALPASSAVRTQSASVPVSFRPPGCSPTADLARFGSYALTAVSASPRTTEVPLELIKSTASTKGLSTSSTGLLPERPGMFEPAPLRLPAGP